MASGFVRATWIVCPPAGAFPENVSVPCTEDGSPTVIGGGARTWRAVVNSPSAYRAISASPSYPSTPTAHASVADTTETPANDVDAEVGGFGLGTIDHAIPSQCSMNVWSVIGSQTPTAQTSSGPDPATAEKDATPGLGVGASVSVHVMPSQCSASGSPRGAADGPDVVGGERRDAREDARR